MSTHNGYAFQTFVCDLLRSTLPKYGLEWQEDLGGQRYSVAVFPEEFGEAVILFRERHAKEFMKRISDFKGLDCDEDVCSYVEHSCERIFKGNIPLMELFVFCAFFLDLAIYCIHNVDLELLIDVTDFFSIFNCYVMEYFTVVGGWSALFQVAMQYRFFVHVVNSYGQQLQ